MNEKKCPICGQKQNEYGHCIPWCMGHLTPFQRLMLKLKWKWDSVYGWWCNSNPLEKYRDWKLWRSAEGKAFLDDLKDNELHISIDKNGLKSEFVPVRIPTKKEEEALIKAMAEEIRREIDLEMGR